MSEVNVETYFRDHWIDIEAERFERYLQMFRITDMNRAVYFDPLGAQPAETIVDFGCGPGDVAVELARAVGPSGAIHGIDLNADLLATARTRADEAGVGGIVTLHHVVDATIPLPDSSADRVIFKSVLLYVPDPACAVREAFRVLRPGGAVVCQDIDFWLTACTAFSPQEWRDFQDAVRPAFSDPNIGRNLRGHLVAAGFKDITTKVSAFVDEQGAFIHTLNNFFGYAKAVRTLTDDEITDMASRAARAIDEGTWCFILNFFQVNGTR